MGVADWVLKPIITPILEKFMTDYFSNFDRDKYHLEFNGAVDLMNLLIKPKVIEDLKLPFRLCYGKLGHIHIDFGVTSFLYGDTRDVTIEIEELYLLLIPPGSQPYDPSQDDTKENKRNELQKLLTMDPDLSDSQPSEESSNGVISNTIIGIINNVKINIKHLHIRYEDEQSNKNSPFSFGITLKTLSAISTDSSWNIKRTAQSETTFFKLLSLEGLGLYWNSNRKLWNKLVEQNEDDFLAKMKGTIADEKNLEYIIGPLIASAKVMATMHPNRLPQKFSKPLVDVGFSMETFRIQLTNEQFQDVIFLMESIEDMNKRKPYLFLRPFNTPYKRNSKKWWTYAYKCMKLKIQKQSISKMYDAQFLLKQKRLCDEYELAIADYRQKLALETATDEDKKKCEDLEDMISNEDIIIIRKKVSFKDEKVTASQSSSYWGWGSKAALEPDKLKEILAEKLTSEQMEELQKYIILEKDDIDADKYPPGYSQIIGHFELPEFVVNLSSVQENGERLHIFNLSANDFTVSAESRPAEEGIDANISLGNFKITGMERRNGKITEFIRSLVDDRKIFSVSYSKNPIGCKPGNYVKLNLEKLEFIYDAPTLQGILDCLTWPSGVQLKQTTTELEKVIKQAKNISIGRMKGLIQQTNEIYLDIKINAPYFLIPSGGNLEKTDTILVLNMGLLTINTIPRERTISDKNDIELIGISETDGNNVDVSESILKMTYNQYAVKIVEFEIFIALEGEDIKSAINHSFLVDSTPEVYHPDRPSPIFRSDEITVELNQCIFTNDPRFPLFKVHFTIDELNFQITSNRALKLVRLIISTPLPTSARNSTSSFITDEDDEEEETWKHPSVVEDKAEASHSVPRLEAYDPEKALQLTRLILNLEIRSLRATLIKMDDETKEVTPLVDLNVNSLEASFKFRTFGMSLDATLECITAQYLDAIVPGRNSEEPAYLIYSEGIPGLPLLRAHIFSISEACPKSEVGDIRQKFLIDMNSIHVLLHQEAISEIIAFLDKISNEFIKSDFAKPQTDPNELDKSEDTGKIITIKKSLGLENIPNSSDILFWAKGTFSDVSLSLTSNKRNIAKFELGEVVGEYKEKMHETLIFAQITEVEMLNLDTPTLYNTILSIGDEVLFLSTTIRIYKKPEKTIDPDLDINFRLNFTPIILIGNYAGNIIDFLIHLKEAHENYQSSGSKKDVLTLPTLEHEHHQEKVEHVVDKKIVLDCDLVAPKLIIVKDENSPEAVVIDLGRLIINNRLEEIETSISGKCAVLDNMQAVLKDLSISRAVMEGTNIKAWVHLLKPVKLNVGVKRNLTAWYPELPKIDISADLEPVELSISRLDIEIASTCVLNYIERLQRSFNSFQSVYEQEASDTASPGESYQLGTAIELKAQSQKLGISVKFVELGCMLYSKPTILDEVTNLVQRDTNGSLAEFCLKALHVDFKNWNNEDINASLTLDEILLMDSRPTSGEIKDFITKKIQDETLEKHLLSVTFQLLHPKENTKIYDVGIKSQGLSFILHLDFIKLLADFVVALANSLPKKKSTAIEDFNSVNLKRKKNIVPTILKADEARSIDVFRLFQGNIGIEEIELIFLEDLHSSETNALVAYGNFGYKMDSEIDRGSAGSGIWKFGIVTAKYKANANKEEICQVLEPVELKLAFNLNYQDGTNLDLKFTDFILHLNAGTVLLATKVVKAIQASIEKAKNQESVGREQNADEARVWEPKRNAEQNYWFLDFSALEETVSRYKQKETSTPKVLLGNVMMGTKNLPEKANLIISRKVIIFEAGIGTKPTPLLIIDGNFNITASNWSKDLEASGSFGGSVYYNNVVKGAREYLVETIEVQEPFSFGKRKRRPWQMDFKVVRLPAYEGKKSTAISVTSNDMLEVTISKTAIKVLKSLADNFGKSLNLGVSEDEVNSPPYVLANNIGTDAFIELNPSETSLIYTENGKVIQGKIKLEPGKHLDLGLDITHLTDFTNDQNRLINLSVPAFAFNEKIGVQPNSTAYFQVEDNTGSFGMLVDIKSQENFSTLISIRSVVEIKSELAGSVEVTAVTGSRVQVSLGTLLPRETMNLPVSLSRYGVGNLGLSFKPLGFASSTLCRMLYKLDKGSNSASEFVSCKSETEGGVDDRLKVFGASGSIPIFGKVGKGRMFNLSLKPSLIVNNYFSIMLNVSSDGKSFLGLNPGEAMDMLGADTHSYYSKLFVTIKDYLDTTWSATLVLSRLTPNEFKFVDFHSLDGRTLYFNYQARISPENEILEEITFFSPYMMVNRTGKTLIYQVTRKRFASRMWKICKDCNPCVLLLRCLVPLNARSYVASNRITHENSQEDGVMLPSEMDGHDNITVRFSDSKNSSALNLKAAIVDFHCTSYEKDYEVVTSISTNAAGLTKIVSFLPKYTINNKCKYNIIVLGNGEEVTVPANTLVPFWPKKRVGETIYLQVKVDGTENFSSAFKFEDVYVTLLKLPNAYGGINANINVLENLGILTISEFSLQNVPVLIVNDTNDIDIAVNQLGTENSKILVPARKSIIYTWEDTNLPTKIVWFAKSGRNEVHRSKFDATKDEFTDFNVTIDSETKTYFCTNFKNGARSIFLITRRNGLREIIKEYLELGQPESSNLSENSIYQRPLKMEIDVDLDGIGVSLVHDEAGKEVLYSRLDGRSAVWESGRIGGDHFKTLSQNEIIALEKGFIKYVEAGMSGPIDVGEGITIDYSNFIMYSPQKAQLRRHAYQPGIALKLKMFEFGKEITVTIGKAQIDNQLKEAEYPQMLSIIDRSASMKSQILPPLFIGKYNEWGLGNTSKTIEGTLVLQEFKVAVDYPFIKSVLAVFSDVDAKLSTNIDKLYKRDQKKLKLSNADYFKEVQDKISSDSAISVYKLLQIYKINVNLTANLNRDPNGGYVQNLLLGLGSVVNVSGVSLSLNGLMAKDKHWTQQQLKEAVIEHYKSEIMSNIYKFVLNLEVLGNPGKLITGIGTGLTSLVTDPIQGAMEGDLIGGLSTGAEAALGGTVFGITDSLGSVTKQLGKLTGGLGIPGLPSLLGLTGNILQGLNIFGWGRDEADTPTANMRPKRILNVGEPIQQYSFYEMIGDIAYSRAQNVSNNGCGSRKVHFVNSTENGLIGTLLLTENRLYFMNTSQNLDSFEDEWSYDWNEIQIGETSGNSISFYVPQRGIFITRKIVKINFLSTEVTKVAHEKCWELWQRENTRSKFRPAPTQFRLF